MELLFKIRVYEACLSLIKSKVAELRTGISSLQESMLSESKSTAGDKHETGRAMMQLEMEKLGTQLKELENQKLILEKTDVSMKYSAVNKGSLIKTDKGYLFLAIGLGKISIEDKTVFAISPESPLGAVLMGRGAGQDAQMNAVSYKIIEVI
jgi:hypothetical protein